ncbi:O-acetyl-ADP-ribose deacetylase MACROD2-like [Notothenia coriiceps]|uniref:O-acetyl-ADP-ribose deacetylase MACROD2-like n=1 Tax=Notothenia coriiceps TaxID=8208 RepID=A0A6I9P650_9TELE|nr:PREDICTED: O-acetyl-ADP-ribose deacetylase MACROD2-like [Notothenia coriiceps]
MSKKKKDWKTEKERLLRLDREERRKEYRRQDFISLDKIPAWREETRPNDKEEVKELTDGGGPINKVSLYKGDITVLEVDAIVNAVWLYCLGLLLTTIAPGSCRVEKLTNGTLHKKIIKHYIQCLNCFN